MYMYAHVCMYVYTYVSNNKYQLFCGIVWNGFLLKPNIFYFYTGGHFSAQKLYSFIAVNLNLHLIKILLIIDYIYNIYMVIVTRFFTCHVD